MHRATGFLGYQMHFMLAICEVFNPSLGVNALSIGQIADLHLTSDEIEAGIIDAIVLDFSVPLNHSRRSPAFFNCCMNSGIPPLFPSERTIQETPQVGRARRLRDSTDINQRTQGAA
jgi:hypothetical protein